MLFQTGLIAPLDGYYHDSASASLDDPMPSSNTLSSHLDPLFYHHILCLIGGSR